VEATIKGIQLFKKRKWKLAAAAPLFLNIIESGVAAVIGILGIGLIAAAGAVSASRS
jgi:hypothetical protein